MKGLTNSRFTNMSCNVLLQSVEQHVWSTLCNTISKFIIPPFTLTTTNHTPAPKPLLKESKTSFPNIWKWITPDLSKEGQFYTDRIASLRIAVDSLGPDNELFYSQGLEIPEEYKNNYGSNGPSSLVILWWE